MGEQRYYGAKEKGSHALIYYFPDGPQPEGKIRQRYWNTSGPRMLRADSRCAQLHWTQATPLGSNWIKHDTSPWGAAPLIANWTIGNNGWAGSFESGGPVTIPLWDPASRWNQHSWVLYATVKHRDGIGNYPETFLTHFYELFIEETLEISMVMTAKQVKINHGAPSVSQSTWTVNLANWWPDDGWFRFAFVFQHGIGSSTRSCDLYLNGNFVATKTVMTPLAVDMTRCTGVRVGANYQRKDGYSWDGWISQVACVATEGVTKIPASTVNRWMEDPWYFLKAERLAPHLRGCIQADVQSRPAVSADVASRMAVAAGAQGQLAVSADVASRVASGGGVGSRPAVNASVTSCRGD